VGRLADGARFYAPLTLPGELVRGTVAPMPAGGLRLDDAEILQPSRDRVTPPCPHFGVCGGCVLQHWAFDAQTAWKADAVAHALHRAGFEHAAPAVAPATPPGARRRMDLALGRGRGGRGDSGSGVLVGLHARGAGGVVQLSTCHVLAPALVGLIDPLRMVLAGVAALRRGGSAVANLLEGGVDLLLRLDAALLASDRAHLIAFATARRLLRLSVAVGAGEPEPLCVFRPPVATFAGVAVRIPPGAFLQASETGEAAIVSAVLAGLPENLPRRAWIADLYAGCGTLTFPLAARARVAAFEGDEAAAAALKQAADAAGLGGRIGVARRDLARRPVSAAELADCAAAVLDPPHAGAGAQVAQLAAARVPRVVYVSCNPQALARDAAVLGAAGYRLLAATAIDQFRWSARVESVAAFAR
jgi:23S rRNA (uracil1939-C5)-methyltransferase